MDIVIPSKLVELVVVVACIIVYSVAGVIVGGLYYRYYKTNCIQEELKDIAIGVSVGWPLYLLIICIWCTVFLPARLIFNKITGE